MDLVAGVGRTGGATPLPDRTDPMLDPTQRKLAFQGLRNFRDFGGYATTRGQPMAAGRFYRSAQHALATDEDLAKLAAMEISAVVDLRRPPERERMPSRRWTDFDAQLIENDDHDEGAGKDSWEGFMAEWDMSETAIREYNYRYYERAVGLPRLHDLYSRYFKAVGESVGPVIVHCAAGKDRTGIICALTHMVAGVHRDDIIADYLLTNDHDAFAVYAPLWQEDIAKQRGSAPPLETMYVAMGVDEAYLARAFATIDKDFGGVEAYLRDALGVDAPLREKIEKRLFA